MNKLEPGDIVLTKEKAIVSGLIRIATDSDVSHAMLYVERGSIIHALTNGVHSDNIQRILFKSKDDAICLRLKQTGADQIKDIACDFVRREVGKTYSRLEAVKTKLPRWRENASNQQYCSRLVAMGYEHAGVKLVNDSSYCTPEELRISELLTLIPDVLYEASPEEIEFSRSESPLARQARITNDNIAFARNITGKDLQTEDQIIEYLKSEPLYDEAISEKYRSSGYFDLWRNEKDKNAWRYDALTFIQSVPLDQLVSVAQVELQDAQRFAHKYAWGKDRYEADFKQTGLKFCDQMMRLCEDMVLLHRQRIGVCAQVLEYASRSSHDLEE